MDRAVAEDDKKKIRWLTYILTKKSSAVKTLAIHRVTVENNGKYTAGIDGIKVAEGKSKEVKEYNKDLRRWLSRSPEVLGNFVNR